MHLLIDSCALQRLHEQVGSITQPEGVFADRHSSSHKAVFDTKMDEGGSVPCWMQVNPLACSGACSIDILLSDIASTRCSFSLAALAEWLLPFHLSAHVFDSHALSDEPVHNCRDVVLAADSGLQHIDSSAAEVDGQGQVPAEHVTLTFETPAPANAQYTELQNVGLLFRCMYYYFQYIFHIYVSTQTIFNSTTISSYNFKFQFHNTMP